MGIGQRKGLAEGARLAAHFGQMLEHLGFLAEKPSEETEVRADHDYGIQHPECGQARTHGLPQSQGSRESRARGRQLTGIEEGDAERMRAPSQPVGAREGGLTETHDNSNPHLW